MDIPEQFLGKISQQLARSGFVEIVQGARGGYRLLKTPSEITLLAVVEAAIGGIFLNDCVMNQKSCGRSPFCAVHRIWEEARNQLRATLREATFDVLAAEESCLWSPSTAEAKPGKMSSQPQDNVDLLMSTALGQEVAPSNQK
jgi:Rrf2 family protein